MSDRKTASVIRGSSVSSTSRIQRAAMENVTMREMTADLRPMKVELRAANEPGMREKSQKRAQSIRRRLKYHAGSYTNMRRCHFSSRIQVPCSLRLYSSDSVGTSVFQVSDSQHSVKRVKESSGALFTYQVYRILCSCCEVVDGYSRDLVGVALLEDFTVVWF